MIHYLYQGMWYCARPFIGSFLARRVKAHKEDPARLQERYGYASQEPFSASPLWIHGASVGESMISLSVAEKVRQHHPHLPILITTTTRTGAEQVMKRLPENSTHQYLPLDDKTFHQRFLKTWHPRALVLIESEFWPNLLNELKHQDIPCIALDAHLSESSHRLWRRLHQRCHTPFQDLSHVYVSSPLQAERFRSLGVRQMTMIPPLKFANIPLPYPQKKLEQWQKKVEGRPIWLAASTHAEEEEWILQAHQMMQKILPHSLLIWAPRHMDRIAAIAQKLEKQGWRYQYESDHPSMDETVQCLLVNRLGQLGLFYQLCPMAFVAGSLVPDIGGHNIIEAMQLKCVPFHGPYMSHAPQVVDLCKQAGLHLTVHTPSQLVQRLVELTQNPEALQHLQDKGFDLCHAQMKTLLQTFRTFFDGLDQPCAG